MYTQEDLRRWQAEQLRLHQIHEDQMAVRQRQLYRWQGLSMYYMMTGFGAAMSILGLLLCLWGNRDLGVPFISVSVTVLPCFELLLYTEAMNIRVYA